MKGVYYSLRTCATMMYLYRLYLLIAYNDMQVDIMTLGLHSVVAISSILCHNMHVYPEFQILNGLFVMRSILCCICFYYEWHIVCNMMICFATMYIADIIKLHYNFPATETRLIPYLKHLPYHEKQNVIQMYSFMQLVATYYMLENANTAYSPIFAIQICPFLISLVQKDVISRETFHYTYTMSMLINIFCILSTRVSFFLEMYLLCIFMFYWRIKYGMNKYAGWMITFGMHYILKSYLIMYEFELDMFYVYLCKYAIIAHILNYYHIKYFQEYKHTELILYND